MIIHKNYNDCLKAKQLSLLFSAETKINISKVKYFVVTDKTSSETIKMANWQNSVIKTLLFLKDDLKQEGCFSMLNFSKHLNRCLLLIY